MMMRRLFSFTLLGLLAAGCQQERPAIERAQPAGQQQTVEEDGARQIRRGSPISPEETPEQESLTIGTFDIPRSLGELHTDAFGAGLQPLQPIGATDEQGDPLSRAWIGYQAGAGPGSGESSMRLLLHTNAANIARPAPPLARALVHWHLETDRVNWESAQVAFQWAENEAALLLPDSLALYRTDSEEGPWERVEEQAIDLQSRRASGTVTALGHFMLFGTRDPEAPVTPDIVDVVLGRTEAEDRLDLNGDGTIDASDISISAAVGGEPDPTAGD